MRSFIGFGQAAYIGQPYSSPIKLAGISGVAVPLLLQWISYGASSANPNINVLVSLETSACKAVDQIRSIYIDNLGSPIPVYVYFPDTGETLSAKANSEGWYPVFTNAKRFWVIGEGFLDGSIPQTYIIVSNIPMQASVNTEIDQSAALWLASPVITRGNSIYNSKYGTPALGDQTSQVIGNFQTNFALPAFGSPYPSGFITLTGLALNLVAVFNAATTAPTLFIESTGVAGILYQFAFLVGPVPTFGNLPGVVNVFSQSGLQLKLDATQTWRIRNSVTISGGQAQLISQYTVGPN